MNKTDLANVIADRHDLAKVKAKALVDDVFTQISQALERGESVAIDRFGRFKPTQRKARKGRNPQTGKEIKIPASRSASFSSSKTLKDSLNR